MESNSRILVEEYNIISLRTALVMDDGESVGLQLAPADSSVLTRLNPFKDEFMERFACYFTFLYLHQHIQLDHNLGIKKMQFVKPPAFKLLWVESGNSVAVCINGEPWAFVHEETQKSYSKGVLGSRAGNPWNQELFEKTFQTD